MRLFVIEPPTVFSQLSEASARPLFKQVAEGLWAILFFTGMVDEIFVSRITSISLSVLMKFDSSLGISDH